ncbi:transcription initiation factor TFIID 23-30kDa subunit-domain-containing protein [Kickxella alabastrina]|uniref:transcription initiation factor TFIID 23-30kDa subunit-domain-containing protein n=1 Tax=Kickxella alabastrina TaxID=61397 RepID=UPI00221FE891|nr:transcription initiation factor TFIID 23-30kDa subunit-domain-containing protein [Kickxella alabastrina]KAI7828417.1 transcription initiation factor TFIID 23-30kDa subunit-domain-containing protein [Kickxella alabastrina]KAJ1934024.1 hypothetical protein GGF37_006523 [Kickxella alabastrina]
MSEDNDNNIMDVSPAEPPLDEPSTLAAVPQTESDQRASTPISGRMLSRSEIQSEKSLAEFLVQMDNYAPIIPEALTEYYLAQAGFECTDVRIKRLLALATQKFISDVATDAFQYNRIRQQASKEKKFNSKDRKTVLSMDDLTAALAEYGVNIKKPEYFS